MNTTKTGDFTDVILDLSLLTEKRFFRRSKSGDILAKNPVVRSKSYNNPLLTPVAEYETEGMAANGTSIRRHSVSEMTSCLELQGYSNLTTIMDNGSKSSMTATKNLLSDQERSSAGPAQCSGKLGTVEQQKGHFHSMDDPHRSFELDRDPSLIPVPSSSPENIVDQILESIDSDSEGIFIDFGRGCSKSSAYNVDVNRQSVLWRIAGNKPWVLILYKKATNMLSQTMGRNYVCLGHDLSCVEV